MKRGPDTPDATLLTNALTRPTQTTTNMGDDAQLSTTFQLITTGVT